MFIDAHSHLNIYTYKKFSKNLDNALKQIEDNKIVTINTSIDMTSFKVNKELAKKSPYIITAFGIHPLNAYKYVDKYDQVKKLIDSYNIIGEIGLDHLFEKDKHKYPSQRELFAFFLSHAKNKIISVHTCGAEADCLSLLKQYGNKKVIIHWYSGDLNILKKMIAEGFYFSIGAEVLYSDHIKKIAATIPLEQILSETDNPGGLLYLTGKLGMPLLIKDVVKGIAEVKRKDSLEIEQTIHNNFTRLTNNLLSITYLR